MTMQNRGGMSLRKVLLGMSREERAGFLLRMAKAFGEAMEPYRAKSGGEWRWRRKDTSNGRKEQSKKETIGSLRQESEGGRPHQDDAPPSSGH